MKKKFIGMVFAVAILTTLLPTLFISAYAADGTDEVVNAETIITEGTCGDNLTWTLNEDGLLTISGEGEMADYSSGSQPWYSYMDQIKKVSIGDSVTVIGNRAFREFTHLEEVYMGAGVTKIGTYAFYGCTNLTTITIPDNLTSISSSAFSNAPVRTVNIPNSVTTVHSDIYHLATITSFVVTDTDNVGYRSDDGVLYYYEEYEEELSLIRCPQTKQITGTYEILAGTSSIGEKAFYKVGTLETIDIPETVTSIGSKAFDECIILNAVTMHDGLETIGNYAFRKCSTLMTVEIPDSVTSIGSQTFYNCTHIEEVYLGASVTRIGSEAFSGCTSLTTITLPDNLTGVDSSAFTNAPVRVVNIPDSVVTIDSDIYNISTITSFDVTDTDDIGYRSDDGVLYYCTEYMEELSLIRYPQSKKITGTYEILAGTTSIGERAFYGCSALETMEVPDSVTNIGSSAFRDCTNLTEVYMGAGVTKVGNSVFSRCTSLTTITLPDNLTSIGSSAFNNAPVSIVNIPNSVTTVSSDICNLETITSFVVTDTDNVGYRSDDGVLYYYDEYLEELNLIRCPQSKKITGTYEILNGTTSIGEKAFYRIETLKTIDIPETVTGIGKNAFYECIILNTVTMHDGLEKIGDNAFRGCSALLTVKIPDSVTTIGQYAFRNCTLLEEVHIGINSASVGLETFYGCGGMKKAYFYGNAPTTFGSSVFINTASDFTIYYIEGNAGWTTPTWNGYNTATFIPAASDVAVDGVTLNQSSATLEIGETLTLTATVSPADATNRVVTWTSTDNNVATVAEGTVTALSAGTTTITVTTADGGYTAQCEITVKAAELLPENSGEIIIEDTTGVVDYSIKVPVTITDNLGFVSMSLKVSYDPSVLTLIGVEDTGLIPGAMHTTKYTSPYTLTWDNDVENEDITVTGTVAYLTFQIAESAEIGTYPIAITAPKDGILNYNGDSVPFRFAEGEVTVLDVIHGDVNRDRSVTSLDRLVLSRALAEWDGYDLAMIDTKAADVNCDNDVTPKDRMILARHIAEWSGYETLPKLD